MLELIVNHLMNIMLFAAVVNFIFLLFKDSKMLNFDLEAIIKFGGMLVIMALLRIGLKFNSPVETFDLNPSSMLFVFWEDFAFGGSIYIFQKFITKKKRYFIPFIILISLIFASGHLYQGVIPAAITAIVPYFFFYGYGKKYGFGTTGLCHVCYDISTVVTFKLIMILQSFR